MDDAIKAVVEKYRGQLAPIEEQLAPLLAQANKIKDRINGLYELEGEPIPYPEAMGGTPMVTPEQKRRPVAPRPDQYFGRPLATVVKEILEARAEHNEGAISLDQLYSLMSQGGYPFEGKDESTRKRILASSLGKNPAFIRLPNSDHIGLAEWYPSAKRGRPRSGTTITDSNGVTRNADDVLNTQFLMPDAAPSADEKPQNF